MFVLAFFAQEEPITYLHALPFRHKRHWCGLNYDTNKHIYKHRIYQYTCNQYSQPDCDIHCDPRFLDRQMCALFRVVHIDIIIIYRNRLLDTGLVIIHNILPSRCIYQPCVHSSQNSGLLFVYCDIVTIHFYASRIHSKDV